MLVEVNNKTRSKINLTLVRKITEKFLKVHKIKQGVSIVFVGDWTMRKINYALRGKNRPTDVLSFCEKESDYYLTDFLGEIMIDYQQLKRQAKQSGQSVQKELVFILVHGLLHLIGYDHRNDHEEKKMNQLTKKFIAKL